MTKRATFTKDEARRVGEQIGIDWETAPFDVEQFRKGMDVELEHGLQDLLTNVTQDDPIVTGNIALAHLKEFSDYYTRLERMESDAQREHDPPLQIQPGAKVAPPTKAAGESKRGDDFVVRWRLDQLLHAGYDDTEADVLARRTEVDLHFAIDLVRKGCPPATVQRILT